MRDDDRLSNADIPLTSSELDELERRVVADEPRLREMTRAWAIVAIRQLRAVRAAPWSPPAAAAPPPHLSAREAQQRLAGELLHELGDLETWSVDDPLSPFVGETVVTVGDVQALLAAVEDLPDPEAVTAPPPQPRCPLGFNCFPPKAEGMAAPPPEGKAAPPPDLDASLPFLAEFAGWLSGDIPELHAVEVPRLKESLDRFVAVKRREPAARR